MIQLLLLLLLMMMMIDDRFTVFVYYYPYYTPTTIFLSIDIKKNKQNTTSGEAREYAETEKAL